jgi:hypothetical protein
MAQWLGLDGVVGSPVGDLAASLAEAVAAHETGLSALREQA